MGSGDTEHKKNYPGWLSWILEVLKIIATPFMPAIQALAKVIKMIFEAEFLTPQGKMNLAGLALLVIGIAIVSISPILVYVFGDHSVNFDSPIRWIFWSFTICVLMVTSEKMFSSWLIAKYGNKQT